MIIIFSTSCTDSPHPLSPLVVASLKHVLVALRCKKIKMKTLIISLVSLSLLNTKWLPEDKDKHPDIFSICSVTFEFKMVTVTVTIKMFSVKGQLTYTRVVSFPLC